MKLRQLTFQAIGPFAGKETIRFDDFHNSGLFLLQGRTGSGKTSILDAITYALWDDVSRGDESDKSRLRSTFADLNTPTSVELIFEVKAGIFRAYRSQRPSGKTVKKEASLFKVKETSDGFIDIEVYASNKEMKDAVERLIGLTAAQFMQTVILPQGKFAEFLIAKPVERKDILQNIFATHIYQRVEELFKAKKKAATDACTEADLKELQAVSLLLDQDDCVSLREEEASTLTPSKILDHARGILETLISNRELATTQVEKQRSLVECAKKQLTAGEALHRDFARLADLDANIATLDAQSPEIEQAQEEVRRSRALAPLIREIEEKQQFERVITLSTDEINVLLLQLDQSWNEDAFGFKLPECFEQSSSLLESPSSISELKEALEERIERLSIATTLSDRIEVSETLVAKFTGTADEQEKILATISQKLELLPKTQQDLKEKLTLAKDSQAQLSGLEKEQRDLGIRLQAARQVAECEQLIQQQKTKISSLLSAADVTATTHQELHSQWLSNAAAQLGEQLVEGKACPVCGSVEHPDPAHGNNGESDVTSEMVEAAAERMRAADNAVSDAQVELARLQAQKDEADKRADGTIEDISAQQGSVNTQLAELKQLSNGIKELEKQLEELQSQEKSLARDEASGKTQLSHYRSNIKAHKETAQQAQQELAALHIGCDYPADAKRNVEASLIIVQEIQAKCTEIQRTLADIERFDSKIAKLRARHADIVGTMTDEAVLDSSLSDEVTKSLEERISSHVSRRERLRGARDSHIESTRVMSGIDIRTVKTEDLPNLDELKETTARKSQMLSESESQEKSLAIRISGLERSINNLAQQHATARKVHKQYATLLQMADTVNPTSKESSNQFKVSLASWVLSDRFTEVLAAANERLRGISGGRYELQTSEKQLGTHGGNQNGLAINVMDYSNDTLRSTKTLSGGESFYVSLALALGLSDIVIAEQGGVRLETLFIDEGFGTLDSSTLDLVMNELHQLSSQGRMIGMISHVQEMEKMIPEKILVKPASIGKGSTLQIGSLAP